MKTISVIRRVFASVAVLFGGVTIVAGLRVLSGGDPGYVVFRPLLIYNTAMGLAYIAAGAVAWCNVYRGKYAAAAILILNLLVLGAIWYMHVAGSAVAAESVGAMAFRTIVWLALFIGFAWLGRRSA